MGPGMGCSLPDWFLGARSPSLEEFLASNPLATELAQWGRATCLQIG